MLNELDRYEKKKGEKWDASKEMVNLEKMSKEEISAGVPRYYFNMSNDVEEPAATFTPMAIPSPKAKYKTTPYGYYGYPLNPEYFQRLKDGSLPYLDDSKWVTIVEATDEAGLMPIVGKMGTYMQARRDAFKKHGLIYGDSEDSQAIPKGVITTFTKELLDKGYSWVYDPGESIIHSAEPAQVVFLKTSAFKVIDRFQKKDIIANTSVNDWYYLDVLNGEDFPSDRISRLITTIPGIKDVNRLKQLSKHSSIAIKYAVAVNKNTPLALFEEICAANEGVRNQLAIEFNPYNEAHSNALRMFKSGPAGVEKIKKLLKYPDFSDNVVIHCREPNVILTIAQTDPSERAFLGLIKNPAAGWSAWLWLAKSKFMNTVVFSNQFIKKNEEIKYAALMNPVVREDKENNYLYGKKRYALEAKLHGEESIIKALLSDPNPEVREQTQEIIDEEDDDGQNYLEKM